VLANTASLERRAAAGRVLHGQGDQPLYAWVPLSRNVQLRNLKAAVLQSHFLAACNCLFDCLAVVDIACQPCTNTAAVTLLDKKRTLQLSMLVSQYSSSSDNHRATGGAP
jgi:hypothetical protein